MLKEELAERTRRDGGRIHPAFIGSRSLELDAPARGASGRREDAWNGADSSSGQTQSAGTATSIRKLSKFAKELDDGKYAYSWCEAAQEGAAAEQASVDGEGDASGAGLTSHF